MAIELNPIPPEPVSDSKQWRDFFSAVFEILKRNQTAGNGSISWNSLAFPTVGSNQVFVGPVSSSGIPTFRQLTPDDFASALTGFTGSTGITTVGVITIGTWQGDIITRDYLPLNVTGDYAPGALRIPDGSFGFHVKNLTLVGSDRVTLSGTARLSIRN